MFDFGDLVDYFGRLHRNGRKTGKNKKKAKQNFPADIMQYIIYL